MNLFLLFLWHLSLCLHAVASEQQPDSQSNRPPPVNEAVDNGTYGYYPTYTFVTEVDLNAPMTNFMQWNERCNDGLLYFITPRGWGIPNPGPMILDEQGNLLWAKHFANKFGGQAYDFMVQKYRGEEYLTFWLGDDRVRGHGSGFYYMLNSSYDIVHRVGAANGLSADLHEFLITEEGTALMTMYEVVEFDIKDFPDFLDDEEHAGPSYIWDCVFQEIDIETGELVFGWRASDHVDISSTYRGIGPGGSKHDPFDWFHINSIEKDELGNYLISSRYMHSISYIDGRTGDVLWTLGGKKNDFMDLSEGSATNFAWQHDARFIPTDTFPNLYNPPEERPGYTTHLLSFFDNAAEDQHYEYGLDYSRGLLLEVTYPNARSDMKEPAARTADLNTRDMDLVQAKVEEINGTNPDYTVRVVKAYVNPDKVHSSSQGSMQVLPQGHGKDPKVFVGYGLNPVWTEFDADGTVLCDVHYGATTSYERGDIQSYRTYKFSWVGRPEKPPAIDISDDDAEVYVSWNGATEVTEWILQCSDRETEEESVWEDAIRVKKEGFETSISLSDDVVSSRYLRIIALDKSGRRLDNGISATIDRGVIATYLPIFNGRLSPEVTRLSGIKILLILVCTICTMFVLFEAYRRFLIWRTGKQSAGPLRWRKGAAYRLVNEA